MSKAQSNESGLVDPDPFPYLRNIENAFMIFHRKQMLSDEQILYHYTSADGLLGIIESGHLRATHCEYLSDPTEMEYGISLAKEEILSFIVSDDDEHRQTTERGIELLNDVLVYLSNESQQTDPLREFHFVSFSEVEDQLSQWRAFADAGKGFSIGFTKLRGTIDTSPQLGSEINARKVTYDKNYQLEIFYNLIRHGLADYEEWCNRKTDSSDSTSIEDFVHGIAAYMCLATCSLKAPGFSEEQEWRYMVSPPTGHAGARLREVRSRQGFLVPYMELEMKDGRTNCMNIEKIIVGPRQDFRKTQRALRIYLERHGYGQENAKMPEILPSSCSLAF